MAMYKPSATLAGNTVAMQQLYEHLNLFCGVTPADFEHIQAFFEMVEVGKKEHLYLADAPNLQHYFVLEGCLHLYFLNENGKPQTLQFAIANWWLTDYLAFPEHRGSEFYIQAVNPSKVLAISAQGQEALLKEFPQLEAYFRVIYQKAYGAAINRMRYVFGCSKEEIYYEFREVFPDFVKEVPQYLVATYLGLSPEYVSKLNKKALS